MPETLFPARPWVGRAIVGAAASIAALLSACSGNGGERRTQPVFDAIADNETFRFVGNEPFWGGDAIGSRLSYNTMENPDGQEFEIIRFHGMNGMSLSGKLDGQPFDMIVNAQACSDGMSDRAYPFSVMLSVNGETRNGCGWSDNAPFTGPATP